MLDAPTREEKCVGEIACGCYKFRPVLVAWFVSRKFLKRDFHRGSGPTTRQLSLNHSLRAWNLPMEFTIPRGTILLFSFSQRHVSRCASRTVASTSGSRVSLGRAGQEFPLRRRRRRREREVYYYVGNGLNRSRSFSRVACQIAARRYHRG
jgi:hypothetical protein